MGGPIDAGSDAAKSRFREVGVPLARYRPSRVRAIARKRDVAAQGAATSFASTFESMTDQGANVASLYVTALVIMAALFAV